MFVEKIYVCLDGSQCDHKVKQFNYIQSSLIFIVMTLSFKFKSVSDLEGIVSEITCIYF